MSLKGTFYNTFFKDLSFPAHFKYFIRSRMLNHPKGRVSDCPVSLTALWKPSTYVDTAPVDRIEERILRAV